MAKFSIEIELTVDGDYVPYAAAKMPSPQDEVGEPPSGDIVENITLCDIAILEPQRGPNLRTVWKTASLWPHLTKRFTRAQLEEIFLSLPYVYELAEEAVREENL